MLTLDKKPLPAGVKLIGYTLWSPEVQFRTLDIPTQRGTLVTGHKLGSRSVRLDVCIEANSSWEATQIAERLREWCLTDRQKRLKLPRRDDIYLAVECENFPAPQMDKYWEPFEISFRCFEPEFKSDQYYTADVPGAFTIGGNVSTPIIVNFSGLPALTDPVFGVDDYTIAINGETAAGRIYINTNPTEARITNNSIEDITALLTLESDIAFMLEPGEHTFTCPAGVTGSVRWQNRFI